MASDENLRQKLFRARSSIHGMFMINLSRRLASRKELQNRLSSITDIMCCLALLGIVLMIIENEINFSQINNRDTIASWTLKLIITIATIILIGLVFLYHRFDLTLSAVNNSTDDWRVGLTYKKIFLILLEVIVCAIHPAVGSFPDDSSPISTISTTQSKSDVPIDVALGLPMFARLYLLCRFTIYHSQLARNAGSQSLGYLNQVSINFSFLMKTYLEQSPILFLLIFCTGIFLIGSWCVRACDYNSDNVHLPMLDAMWFFIVTYTTVGYGDILASTYCARSIATVIAFIGIFSSALLIAVLAQKLMLNRWEKYVYNFVLDSKLDKEYKIQAANIIVYSVKLWFWKRSDKSMSSAQYLRLKRKLYQSINISQKVKKDQRRLIDNCIGLPEIATIQRSANTHTEDTIKKMANLDFKIDNIEEQLIDVNRSINKMQNTLNLLVDTVRK